MKALGFKSWETPPDFFAALDADFHFSLDAAASHENALADKYCTEKGTFHKEDGSFVLVTKKDGLEYDWAGETVFCNPPYDDSISLWIAKAQERRAKTSVLLLPASVDTHWYHGLIDGKFWKCWEQGRFGHTWQGMWHMESNMEILLMMGRLRFWRPALKLNENGDRVDDFSVPSVLGAQPRGGNLLAVFR